MVTSAVRAGSVGDADTVMTDVSRAFVCSGGRRPSICFGVVFLLSRSWAVSITRDKSQYAETISFLAAGIATSVLAAEVGAQQDMGAMQAETRPHQDTVARVMLGQVVKVETAVAIRSLGRRVRDLRLGVPPSQRTCVEGNVHFYGGRGEEVQVLLKV